MTSANVVRARKYAEPFRKPWFATFEAALRKRPRPSACSFPACRARSRLSRRCSVEPDDGSPDGEGRLFASLYRSPDRRPGPRPSPIWCRRALVAVVYGAVGSSLDCRAISAGILLRADIRGGLMLFCYFFDRVGFRRPRSSFRNLVAAMRGRGAARADPRDPAWRNHGGLVHAHRSRRRRRRLHSPCCDSSAQIRAT